MRRNWIKRVFSPKSTSRRRPGLSAEALEDRTTPSILFTPHNAPVQATTAGGPVMAQTRDMSIYLIFWGSYWADSNGQAYARRIEKSLDPMFLNSPYLNSLTQYGVHARAGEGPALPDREAVAFNYTDPNDLFNTTELYLAAISGFQRGLPYDNNAVYFVVTGPDKSLVGHPDDQAEHSFWYLDQANTRPFAYGWISTDGMLDSATTLLSHEVVETLTDPRLDAWRDYTVPPPDNEIADREAQLYTYRVNGYLVQAYWSQADGAYKVDNGTYQTFYRNYNPNDNVLTRGQLVINGDQLGYGYDDTISIEVNAAGGVSVNLNGEVVNFEPDAIDDIVVNTGAGTNYVYVNNEVQGVNLTINDGGNDYVSVGSQGSVQGVRGSVQINNPLHHTQLVINDSADPVARTVSLDSTGVNGLVPGNISFGPNDLSFLTIYGGSGGNTFFVHGTPSTSTGSYAGYTWLSTGAGVDVVYVDGTTGGLYVNGVGGHDYVYVGTDTSVPNPTPGTGTLANIKGFVSVYNPSGVTTLYVDDAADATSRNATLTGTSLIGLAPAPIYWTPTSSSISGGVDDLRIYGSAASSTYYVNDSPNMAFGANLLTGAGNDSVHITGTSGFLTVSNRGGYDSVYVGNGTVAGLNGSVNIGGAGSTYLIVQDYLDTAAHNATLTAYGLMGLSAGTIWWTPSATAMGGVTYLKILGGAAGSTYIVNDTPNLLYGTDLMTGAGSDYVSITGTTGSLNVINAGGYDSVTVGSNGSLAAVNGDVNLSGNGSIYLYIQDYLDTTSHTATLTATSLTGLSRGAIRWVPTVAATGGVTFLYIWGSAAGSIYNVTDTPNLYYYTDLNTGAGDDRVNITGTTDGVYLYNAGGNDNVYVGNGALADINGFVYVSGSGSTSLYVLDGNDTVSRNAVLTATTLTGLSAGTIYWVPSAASTGGVNYLVIDGSAAGSTYNVTDTPNLRFSTTLTTGAGSDTVSATGTSGFLTVYNHGGYDNVLVGNGTLVGINGTVYVTGAGSTYLYVQDYSDTTSRSATLTGNTLTGLSAGMIQWDASPTAMGGVTYLRIWGSAAGSTYTVTDTPNVLYYTDLITGAGSYDTVNVNGTTGGLSVINWGGSDAVSVGNGTLANFNGNVSVSGAGSTYLSIEDFNDTTPHNVTLTATSLTGLSRGAIQWVPSSTLMGGVVSLDISGSAAKSTYTVSDTPNLFYNTSLTLGDGSDSVFITGTTGALDLYTGGGADTVVVGRLPPATVGNVAGIKGNLNIDGGGTVVLTVDDSGDTNGRGATLTGFSLTGLAPAEIDFSMRVTSLTVNAGSGNDTLTVTATPPSTAVTFNGGAGADTLAGPNTSNVWNITNNAAGYLNGIVSFANVENLVGGTGVDSFAFGAVGQVSNINGGGAPAGQGDWLDYTAATTAVSANLATGIVSGVTGTATGIQNVLGGNHGNTLTGNAQGNILIGGDGADTIIGGSGRSILIGGKGADTITGGAADDILIGGHTAYESAGRVAGLMDILARWQSADSYATRVSNLRVGYRSLVAGTTVFDDGAADRVSGAGGTDWFWVGANDAMPDWQAGEAIN
jgi:hypothetical protein